MHKWKQPPKELHLGIDPSGGAPHSSWGYCLIGREDDVDVVVACGEHIGGIQWNMQSRAMYELFFSLFNNLRSKPDYRDAKIYVHVDSSFGLVSTSLHHEIFTHAPFPNVEVSVPFRASTKIDTATIRCAIRKKRLCFAEDCGVLNASALIGQTYPVESTTFHELISALRVALHFTQNKVVPVEEIPGKIEFEPFDGKSLRYVITSRQLIYNGNYPVSPIPLPIVSRYHSTDTENDIVCPVSPAFAEANPDILMPQPESDQNQGNYNNNPTLIKTLMTSGDIQFKPLKVETENKQEAEKKNDSSPFPLVFEEAPPLTSILGSKEADKIKGKLSDHALVKNVTTRSPIRFQTLVEVHCGQCGVLSSHAICYKCFRRECVTLNQTPFFDEVVKPATSGSDCTKCGSWTDGVICHTCYIGMP